MRLCRNCLQVVFGVAKGRWLGHRLCLLQGGLMLQDGQASAMSLILVEHITQAESIKCYPVI